MVIICRLFDYHHCLPKCWCHSLLHQHHLSKDPFTDLLDQPFLSSVCSLHLLSSSCCYSSSLWSCFCSLFIYYDVLVINYVYFSKIHEHHQDSRSFLSIWKRYFISKAWVDLGLVGNHLCDALLFSQYRKEGEWSCCWLDVFLGSLLHRNKVYVLHRLFYFQATLNYVFAQNAIGANNTYRMLLYNL